MMLSTFNITVQLSSPRWVVGRSLAIYQMVVFGGLAIGSWMWGEVAESHGLVIALAASSAILALSTLLGFLRTLAANGQAQSRRGARHVQRDSEGGAGSRERPRASRPSRTRSLRRTMPTFVRAMQEVRRIRRRDGARRWMLMQDMTEPEVWVERFHSPSWVEHVRRYHRFTVSDQEIERRALALHRGTEPPKIRHLLERSAGEFEADEESEAQKLGDQAVVSDPNLPSSAGST